MMIILSFCILLRLNFVCSLPLKEKIPVDVNIREHRITYVTVSPSVRFFGGVNYNIQRGCRHTHIIGDILDGDKLIISGDSTAVSRYLLTIEREDNTKYIRVITRRKLGRKHSSQVHEFIKEHNDIKFYKVFRIPLQLDILSQQTDKFVNADVVVDWEPKKSLVECYTDGQVPEEETEKIGIPRDLDILPVKFTVKDDMQDDYVISTVKYGRVILDTGSDTLISREVSWEGGIDDPYIQIVSRYNNWTQSVVKYKYIGGEYDRFYIYKKKINQLDLRE
ncbi:signal peptide containing protein [Theileria equi strain WA]|uniref:Signal peptide containing protein n=1 Tax=Theileria equi strain WA TaxID=1537102 RepID=L1LAD9_THEEQ|nr:signal peptide containing protein [Theileria equi strain WA]EKX72230.1 signal peptide containing protein [Theileria equi strain WA]|eukprot:XP_004831682.1 signal peptide containing protein [Theileria equi strain WA]